MLSTFPDHFPGAKPSFIFFDNNCLLLKHIRANKEHRFDNVGLPVDVFHAINKHSEGDEFCQQYCNPYAFPELWNDKYEWVFNSSAAEQANVWFGKFLPVVREMGEIRYNFFLDEMIAIYNEHKVAVQQARGRRPRVMPLEELQRSS